MFETKKKTEKKSFKRQSKMQNEQSHYSHQRKECIARKKSERSKKQVNKEKQDTNFFLFLYHRAFCVDGRSANTNLPNESRNHKPTPQKSDLVHSLELNADQPTMHGGTIQVIENIRTIS